ncbi:MAG: MFS transporter [Candidatus Kapabacteria bacterium]|nr:MFS transporter [Ignavibacteriota bacterium]MCW5885495.1 MFS transporter [Candidatus Kapabacteria bacterium]
MKSNLPNKKLLSLLFAGVLMGALDIAVIGPALPAIKFEYGIDIRQASWVFNIYLLMHLLSAPIMAKLSDTYGRRYIYIINVLLFAIGSILIVISPNYLTLLIGRGVQGFGAGGIFPVASAVIGDTFPKDKQGIALGLIGTVFGLAFILGPILGGFLLMYDWRWIFAINLPIAAVIIFFAFILVPKIASPGSRKFDFLGLLLLTIILSSFSLGINSIQADNFSQSIFSLDVLPFLLISIVLVPAFWNAEIRAENPIIDIMLFKKKQLLVAYIIGFGAGMCEAAAMYAPALAKLNFNVSDSDASFMLLPMVAAMFFSAPLSGFLIDKKGPRFTLLIGTSASTISLLLLTLFADSLAGFYAGGCLLGMGLAFLLGAPLRYIINNELERDHRAVGQGVVTLSTSTGQILSAALLGGVIASFGTSFAGFQTALGLLIFVGIAIVFAAFKLKKRGE